MNREQHIYPLHYSEPLPTTPHINVIQSRRRRISFKPKSSFRAIGDESHISPSRHSVLDTESVNVDILFTPPKKPKIYTYISLKCEV